MARFIDIRDDVIQGNKDGIPLEADNGNLVVGRSAVNKVELSTDGGSNWSDVYTWASSNHSTLLKFRASNGYLYFGSKASIGGVFTGTAEMIRSTDNGVTWTKVLDAESSALWHMAEDSLGNLYIAEYSAGLQDADELYGRHIWKSTDNGATWSKMYSFPQNVAPGYRQGCRHLHIIAVDSDDNIFVGTGDGTSYEYSPHFYKIDSDGSNLTLISERGNGMTAFVETDRGDRFFGSDSSEHIIFKMNSNNTAIGTVVDLEVEFGDPYHNVMLNSVKGKDGVLYFHVGRILGQLKPSIVASADDGETWVFISYTEDDGSSPHYSINPSRSGSRLYIGRNSGLYYSIPDYTKAQLKALYTSTATIVGTLVAN